MTGVASAESRIFDSAEALAQGVAEWLCALAQARRRDFAVCLSGGSTPRRLYERLAMPAIASRLPWHRAHWFWGDEQFVPHDHPDSNYRMAHEALFSRVGIPPDNIHAIPTEGLSPDQAAAAYETVLKRFHGAEPLSSDRPLFDVTLLGIGEDGHTASLFPGQPALMEKQRWAVAVVGAKAEPRITLTYPALDSSRELAFLATGERKRRAVTDAKLGGREVSRGHGSAGRASPLVHGSRCDTRRSEVMSMQFPSTDDWPSAVPAVVIVMGVSGSGKSTVGALLALRLRWEFEDGDWFHPASNVEKMHAGIPLTDEDRWPWLRSIAAWIDTMRRSGEHGVVTCSALKRRYRDVLIGARADVRLVYLKGEEALIARRIATRHEHFMPRRLLHSQFEALEEPGQDEEPIIVSIEPTPREVVARVLSALSADELPAKKSAR